MRKSALAVRRSDARAIILGCLAWPSVASAVQALPDVAAAGARMGRISVPWVPNAGQWDADAAFRAQSFAGAVWIKKDGTLVHQFNGPKPSECLEGNEQRRTSTSNLTGARPQERCNARKNWILSERFVNGAISDIVGTQTTEGRVSFFVGNEANHAADLPSHGALDLGEVFPGVSVELKASDANVEKLFTVAAGRDVRAIRMRLEGTPRLTINKDGSLEATTDHGSIAFTAPIAFQFNAKNEREDIPVRYQLAPSACGANCHEYGFTLGNYDRTRPITIDPLLQSTYHGGSSGDYAQALAIHPVSGEVYVAGHTTSTNLPGAAGAQGASGGFDDAFITRFNASLTARLQTTYHGGSGFDRANALAIDPASGEVYVAGLTDSNDLPGSGGAQGTLGGGTDAFVTRFNADLSARLQTTYHGGSGDDFARALAIHPVTGEAVVAGETTSTNLPGVSSGAQATPGGGKDAFITRFNASLTARLQSTYHGGSSSDVVNALAIHPASGEVLVAGDTNSADLPGVSGGAQAARDLASADAFVTRFNATLTTRLQSTYHGGSNSDWAAALAIHPISGEVLVAGHTISFNLPGATGGAQPTKVNAVDAFITRFSASLKERLQSTYHGGFGLDFAYALAVHPVSGEVVVAGETSAADLPGVSGGAQATLGGGTDAFVARFNRSLTARLQSTYHGGSGNDRANALAIHPVSGEVYVAGTTDSTNLPGPAGAQGALGGGSDAFVSHFSLDLAAGDAVPDAFSLPAQFGVPVSSLRSAGPVRITGLGVLAPITIDGTPTSEVCVSTTATCSCNASPGGVFGPSGNVSDGQYLCARHVSAATPVTYSESRVVVGGFATKFVTFTGVLAACDLDMDNDALVTAPKEGLVIARALMGFTPANAVVGTGISQTQWDAKRTALAACGIAF